jgi:hypothetical protein
MQQFINKLYQLTSEETQRLAYSYRDILMAQEDRHMIAHRSMLSMLRIKNIISKVSSTAHGMVRGYIQNILD